VAPLPPATPGALVLGGDPKARRTRRPALTDAGRVLLAAARPIWIREHGRIEAGLAGGGDALRAGLRQVA